MDEMLSRPYEIARDRVDIQLLLAFATLPWRNTGGT